MVFKKKPAKKEGAEEVQPKNIIQVFRLSEEEKGKGPKITTYPDGRTHIVYQDGSERWTDR